jgi:8-oxo-dGTP pyrophosphatase MutT (NUDIX family)
LEEEETPRDGILREILEETGLKAEIVMPVDTGFFYRGGKEFPMVFISYWCRYVEGEINLSWEHNQFKWTSIEEILEEPTMNHFYRLFERISQLKQYLPENIIIN